jgi:hypothetical protein
MLLAKVIPGLGPPNYKTESPVPTRRSAYPAVAIAAAVVAAIVTPTPDAVSMLLWWLVPTVVFVVLFEVVRIVLPW